MANFGLSRPWVAELDMESGKYRNAFRCAEAVNTSVTPNYVSGSLHADNREVEKVEEFKDASVSVTVSRLPVMAARTMLGHSVGEDGEERDGTEDASGYVGYGFITKEMKDNRTRYRACLLHKVKFSEGEESYETKGDSIVFKTPSLSGSAVGDADGVWRSKSPYYGTEDEADQWIQRKLGVIEECRTPEASPAGGRYAGAQTVTLKTGTDGAGIRYTTDGTTPGAENGQTYTGPLEISSNTGLRAVALKEGAEASPVMTEEYFIGGTE